MLLGQNQNLLLKWPSTLVGVCSCIAQDGVFRPVSLELSENLRHSCEDSETHSLVGVRSDMDVVLPVNMKGVSPHSARVSMHDDGFPERD